MTAFFKNRALGQVDKILVNGEWLARKDIIELLKLKEQNK